MVDKITSYPILITDIGGTNSRMRMVLINKFFGHETVKLDYKRLNSPEFESLEKLIENYLEPFKGTEHYPIFAVIAIPGPIVNNECTILANLPHWGKSSGDDIAKNLGIKKIVLLNDFVVNGYGVMGNIKLDKDFFALTSNKKDPNATMAVIGPGTGLGHGLSIKSSNSKYHECFGSEGGHQTFVAFNDREWSYSKYLKKKLNISHISHERACSGPAIPYMYNFFIDEENMTSKLLDKNDPEFESNRFKLSSEEIVEAANKESCPVAVEVRKMFIEMFATGCSNFCLATLPFNGLYLVGSLTNSFFDFIKNDKTFINRFSDKGRLKTFMESFPIYIVIDQHIGLKGSEEYARRLVEEHLV